jgi:hypothetical protein
MCTTAKMNISEYFDCRDEYRAQHGEISRQLLVTVTAGGFLDRYWISVPFMTSRPTTSPSQHYAQFVTLPDAKIVGPTLRIPFVTDLGSQPARPGRDRLVGGCFSHDSRFLIFYGSESLVVIDVPEVLGETW